MRLATKCSYLSYTYIQLMVTSKENQILKITCEQHGTDQLAYQRSLISAFVIYSIKSMIPELAIMKYVNILASFCNSTV